MLPDGIRPLVAAQCARRHIPARHISRVNEQAFRYRLVSDVEVQEVSMAKVHDMQTIRIRIPQAQADAAARALERLDKVTAMFSPDSAWAKFTPEQERDDVSRQRG